MPTQGEHPPLRIGLCITELNVGGAERCLAELATRLDRAQFAPVVYCLGHRPEGNAAALVERLEAAGISVRFFNARRWRDVPLVLRQLRRAFREDRLDLVQTFLFHANVLGAIAAWRAGVPRIVTGLRVAEPSRRWRRPLERLASRLADRHVAVSEGVARFAREQIGLRPEKLVVIPNGVDLNSASIQRALAGPVDCERLSLPAGRRLIAFVGRLDRQKRIDRLLESAPQLLSELPDHDLVVVGQGSLEDSLRRRGKQLGISQRVHFLGWRDDPAEIMAAADLLVSPSRWEGMSNAILEAMAIGRAIVAFNVEGVVESVGDFDSSQIVPLDDWNGFVNRIVTLIRNSSIREAIGAANRRRVESHFTVDQMIAKYEQLFLALCRPETAAGERP